MSNIFRDAVESFSEPHRTLATKMAEAFEKDVFNNYVIAGSYDGHSVVETIGYWLLGSLPDVDDFVVHHFVGCKKSEVAEQVEFKFVDRIKKAIKKVDPATSASVLEQALMGLIEVLEKDKGTKKAMRSFAKAVRTMLRSDDAEVIGVLTVQRKNANSEPFVVLWQNTRLPRSIVEFAVKGILTLV